MKVIGTIQRKLTYQMPPEANKMKWHYFEIWWRQQQLQHEKCINVRSVQLSMYQYIMSVILQDTLDFLQCTTKERPHVVQFYHVLQSNGPMWFQYSGNIQHNLTESVTLPSTVEKPDFIFKCDTARHQYGHWTIPALGVSQTNPTTSYEVQDNTIQTKIAIKRAVKQ